MADSDFVNYAGYDDPTGIAVPSSEKQRKGYTPLTTDKPGQHLHNTPGTPEDAGKTEIGDDDLYVDTSA